MSRWFVKSVRRVMVELGDMEVIGRREGGEVLGKEGTKWSGISAIEVQFISARNWMTSEGKFFG